MDVNLYRKKISEYSGIPLLNERYSFYYDETGNIRKFKLTSYGVNAVEGITNDFILGGVLFKGDTCSCDINELYNSLNKNVSEIKCKTLTGRGTDFWEAIRKKEVYKFLKWLEKSNLYIHYSTLNNMYYSITDMVDSLFVTEPKFNFGIEWVRNLKRSWYNFVMSHLDEILSVFYRYDYPNLNKENIKDFCYEISDFIKNSDCDDFYLENFRQMLKSNGRKKELCFVEGNTPKILVEEYSSLRINRCVLFKDSEHYFDKEDESEKLLQQMPFTENGIKIKNFQFVDSKDDRLVQISDVWVGLLGKLFFILDKMTPHELISKMETLGAKELECLKIINNLISRSEKLNVALIQNINSIDMVRHRGQMLDIMSQKYKLK